MGWEDTPSNWWHPELTTKGRSSTQSQVLKRDKHDSRACGLTKAICSKPQSGGWGMEGFWRLKKRKKIPQLRVKWQRTYFMQPFLNLTIPSVFIGSKLSDLINYLQNKNRIYLFSIQRNWQQLPFVKIALNLVIKEMGYKWSLELFLLWSPSVFSRMVTGKKRVFTHTIPIWNLPKTTMSKYFYCLHVIDA